ncbi:hypothetical protein BJX99DRAFT_76521 [Aspergillus californicus]
MHRFSVLNPRGILAPNPLRSQVCTQAAFRLNADKQVPSHISWNIFRSLTSYSPLDVTIFPSSNRLSGRICMVTGGSSGIGFAIAERFLQEGADRIILVGRSYKRLVKAAKQLKSSEPVPDQRLADAESEPVATRAPKEDRTVEINEDEFRPGTLIDSSNRISLLVGDVSEAKAWIRELETVMRTVDILVNAAGISSSSVLANTDPDSISQILRTNLEGSILTSRALIRASIRNRVKQSSRSRASTSIPTGAESVNEMVAIPAKCIINISSLLALKGGTGAVSYAASKAGILGLTRSLCVELSRTKKMQDQFIRLNAIVPGYIETQMIADFTENENDKLKDDIPLGRFGRPSEVADAAVFLAQNEYANNCVINLDGGLSAL